MDMKFLSSLVISEFQIKTTMRFHCTSFKWLKILKLAILLNRATGTLIQLLLWESTMEKPCRRGVGLFLLNIISIWSGNFTPRFLTKCEKKKNPHPHQYMSMNIYISFTYDSPMLETIQMSINSWVNRHIWWISTQ